MSERTQAESGQSSSDSAGSTSPNAKPPGRDDFYVGYLPTPASHRAGLRMVVPALVLLVVGAAAIVASVQRDPGAAVWRGEVERFEGILLAEPVPMLIATDDGSTRAMLLVEEGKHGASERVETWLRGAGKGASEGASAVVRGRVLARDGRMIVELESGETAIATGRGAATIVARESLGARTLRGEIIDSKCFHGAMKPGDGKGHKACATLCIRNGIPAMIATPDDRGGLKLRLLAVEGGIDEDTLAKIGEPVEVAGELSRLADMEVVTVKPRSVRRVGR
jgi:hypothetical protein